MSDKLTREEYAEFLKLLTEAEVQRKEFAEAVGRIFNWLAQKGSSPNRDLGEWAGLSSGAIRWLEHYERLTLEMAAFADQEPPLDDLLRGG